MKRKWCWIILVIALSSVLSLAAETDESLDEVVVTATRTEQELKDLFGSVTVITSDEIERSNVSSVEQVLLRVPGINLQESDSFGTNKIRLNMRGLGGQYGVQRVLVMQDGRPLNEEYQGDVDLQLIPLDNVERIEVVKGPGSALYGSYAMGGVINIITKRGQTKPLLDFTTSVADYNTQSYKLRYGAKKDQFDYLVTVSKELTDGYLLNNDGTKRGWDARHVHTKLGWTFNDEASIVFSGGYNGGEGERNDFFQKLNRDYGDLIFKTNWAPDDKAKLMVRAYRNGLDWKPFWKQAAQVAPYDQYTWGGEVQQSYELAERHLLTGGVDTRREDVYIKELAGTVDRDVKHYAVYLQDEVCLLKEKTYLTVGVRYDKTSTFGGEYSPRAGVAHHINDKLTLRASTGKAYRAPTISDLYLPMTFYGFGFFKGNPDLKPETMWSYEVGAEYSFNPDIWGALNLYYTRMKDGRDYMQDPDTIYRAHNVAVQTIKGAEVELTWQVREYLSASGNFSYIKSIYDKYRPDATIEGNWFEEIPRHQGYAALNYKDEQGRCMGLEVRGNGMRYGDAANTTPEHLPAYTVVNLNTSFPAHKNARIFSSISNLFDRRHRDTTDYEQPGRTFMIGTTISY